MPTRSGQRRMVFTAGDPSVRLAKVRGAVEHDGAGDVLPYGVVSRHGIAVPGDPDGNTGRVVGDDGAACRGVGGRAVGQDGGGGGLRADDLARVARPLQHPLEQIVLVEEGGSDRRSR